ncbi:hypothetical protein U9R90_21155 [Streptomyces sp. E11-3]|uniref:hypothetical protein n=1 Tax=Streptomyces sp. E11-3 TaxID=3110112 RepID=UPI00397FE084
MPPGPHRATRHATQHAPKPKLPEEYDCWLVALPAMDGKQYVYRVYAPHDALPADLFWEAWHCHDEGSFPWAPDVFDTAVIRRIGDAF